MNGQIKRDVLKRFAPALALVGLTGLTAGCVTNDDVHQAVYDYRAWEAKYDPIHIPSRRSKVEPAGVRWSQQTFVARFQPKRAILTAETRRRLSELSSRYRGRGVRVTVLLDLPKQERDKKLVDARRATIIRALADSGLRASRVRAVPGSKNADAAVVLIAVQRTVASRCKEWQSAVSGKSLGVEEWRFGCATRSSLRAHVDNPNDLRNGRRLDDYDGANAAKTIDDYRSGKLDKLPEAQGTGSSATTQ